MTASESENTATRARQAWMGLLAKAPEGVVDEFLTSVTPKPEFTFLRQPEIGSVMVKGKTSGTGAAFNLGEVTTVSYTHLTLPTKA